MRLSNGHRPDMARKQHRRPLAVTLVIGLLAFLGASAAGGGIALVANRGAAPPEAWLNDIPLVNSWLLPGLVLGLGFGIGSLLSAYGMLRRPRWSWLGPIERLTGRHWSWAATEVIGAGHIVWIALELVFLPEPSALQIVYGGIGLALVTLPLLPDVREYLRLGS